MDFKKKASHKGSLFRFGAKVGEECFENRELGMNIIDKRVALISTAMAISVLAVGCGESKVAQCNKISGVVNKAANEAIAAGKSSNPDKMGELEKAATSMNQYAKELEAVQVKDEKLKTLQSRFIKMYQDTGKSGLDLVAAAKKKDIKGVNTSLQSLQAATGQESSLVNEFNQYCREK